METFISLFAQLALVSFVNVKAYYFIKNRVLRSAWIGPLLLCAVYVKLSASEVSSGTIDSWVRGVICVVYIFLAVTSLAAILAGYRDRQEAQKKGAVVN